MGWQWVGSVLGGGAVAGVLLAIAGFLGRTQLAHWLNKDIEAIKARHQQDLADRQAQYQRELEAYKMSLITESERARATQEVRKVAALKIAELEFGAINSLHLSTRGLASEAVAAFRVPTGGHDHVKRLQERLDSLRQAQLNADLFLPREHIGDLLRYRQALTDLVSAWGNTERKLSGEDIDKRDAELIRLELAVDANIYERLIALRDLS